jgi:hypothetical protein
MAFVIVSGWEGAVFSAEPAVRMVADDLDFHRAGRTGRGNKLGHATVTQINNDVRYQPGNGAERRAAVRDVVRGADLVRTGLKSQAELEFEDRTITRLGSNTAFTFDPDKREFQLQKGLMLFDMPKTAGGGKIITPACTAAIEGTAGMVSYRSAPKILCLSSGIYISGASVNLGGSTLVPGPTSTAFIYTDHLLSPPSSGAYQVQPLASAPR